MIRALAVALGSLNKPIRKERKYIMQVVRNTFYPEQVVLETKLKKFQRECSTNRKRCEMS